MNNKGEFLDEAVARQIIEKVWKVSEEGPVEGPSTKPPEYWRKVNFPDPEEGSEDVYENVRNIIVPVELPSRDGSLVNADEDDVYKVIEPSRDSSMVGKSFYLTDVTHEEYDSDDSMVDMNEEQLDEYEKAMRSGRVRYMVSNRFCTHQRNYIKCACMCHSKVTQDKYYFNQQSLDDLLAICYELRLRQFSRTSTFEAGDHYHRHYVTVICLTTSDRKIVCDPVISRDKFLTLVYELREHYGIVRDFGEKKTLSGLDFEAQSIGETLQRFLEIVKNSIGKAAKTVAEVVKSVFSTLIDSLKYVFSLISETMANIMAKVFRMLADCIIRCFDPVSYVRDNVSKNGVLIVVICVIAVTTIIQMLGVVAMNIVGRLIDTLIKFFKPKGEKDEFDAEAPADATAGLITLICLILGLSVCEFSAVSKRCREFTSLVTGGIAGSLFLGSLFLILPIAVQTALTVKFGTKEEKEKQIIEQWMLRANAVTRLKKIPKVLVSPEFRVWITELITEAQGLKTKIKTPTVANVFVRLLVSMMEILAMLENYDLEKSHRDYPYSLHIAAPPGYGKTLFASKFIRDLFGTSERDVYTRPVSAEFWDGFINQKVILFDEFLVGDHEIKSRHCLEYLEVVSSKVFKPPLASVDDVAVGLKGTKCEPEGVITINNDCYTKVTNFPNDAIYRRRHFVVKVDIAPKFLRFFKDSTFDFTKLTDEQIKNVSWLIFTLKPCAPRTWTQDIPDLTYNDLITFLREKISEHKITCGRIKAGLHDAVSDDLTPTQLLENAMRELQGVPNEPKTLTEAMFDLMTTAKEGTTDLFKFFSQGPGEGSNSAQQMDESVRSKPRPGTIEREIFNYLKNTKGGHNKSIEMVKKRLDNAHIMLEKLTDFPEGEAGTDRALVHKLFRQKLKLVPDHEVASSSGSNDDYETCSEPEVMPVMQKDVISDVCHTNVDTMVLHRHRCLGLRKEPVLNKDGLPFIDTKGKPLMSSKQCSYNFAHKHEPNAVHEFLCKDCIRDGVKASYVSLHGSINQTGNPVFARSLDLLPENIDSCYMGEDPEYNKRVRELWTDVIIDKYLSMGHLPIVVFDGRQLNPEIDMYVELEPKNLIKSSFRGMLVWCSIFVLVTATYKFFNNDKKVPEVMQFGAQSTKANRERRAVKSKRSFRPATAQSGPCLTYVIDGKEHYGIPLRGQTFLTYYHAFLKEDGNLFENGTEMKIKWRGVSDVVQFHSSMTQACEEDDLIFITFVSKKLSHFPEMVKKFWSEEEMCEFHATPATIDVGNGPKFVTVAKAKGKNYSYFKRKFEMEYALMYRYPTMKGDCGSPIVSCGQHYPGKILGMHVAGGSHNGDSYGLAVIVTREDIEEALRIKACEDSCSDFEAQAPISLVDEAPNLKKKVTIPLDEVVHVPRVSKLRKSVISKHLPWPALKNKPIMSMSDPRANGVDPMIKALNIALEVNHDSSKIDEELLKSCAEATLLNYQRNLHWPIGKRRLTFEEALTGIPGVLSSLKVNSSPGYPLCKVSSKPGKRQFFEFGPNGELKYDPNFRVMCEDYVKRMETEGIKERRFIAYLKDELVSDSKVAKVKTRVIYAGDLISNVAYRMVFGSLLAAFNNSFERTPSAISMNQYSHDMHMMYDYLSEVGHKNFVAGDIDEWDKHQMRPVLKWGYWVFCSLADGLTNELGFESFVTQQNFSPAQFSDELIYFIVTYFSGLLLTTIMNNITQEIDVRYIFARNVVAKVYDEHARTKLGGDDHIYNWSDEVAEFLTPFKIRETFKELGHTYTSDSKDEELKDEFRTFEQITFLGAHPVLINGKYCGAMKKKTLEETLHWTRNRSNTIRDECKMTMELASIWGEDYYKQFCDSVNNALFLCDLETIDMPVCSEMQRVVAGRTAASGQDFPYGFYAQGPPANSLAKLNEHKLVDGVRLNDSQPNSLSSKAVNEAEMNVNFGTESRVFRGQFDWTTSDVPGVPIFTVDVPFGILNLGEPDNVQNMGFDRFVYWKGDIEISFQINATPFQQGLLVAYFVPLAAYPVELANITTCSHVKIQPDQSSTYTLNIPYLYLRSVMNTIARTTESLGTLYVTPLSALSAIDNDTVTLTVYSAFPNSRFTIPRPLDAEPGRNKFYTVQGLESISEMVNFEMSFEAQGNVSSTSISNYWNAGGDMPIEGISNTAGAEAHQDLSADVKIPMPLDNPPLCSGALPVVQHLTSMSASHGVRPTTDLQLKPATLARQQMEIFNPTETKFETLLAHQCLLTKFLVTTSTPAGTELYKITLNTRAGIAEGSNIPINIAVLNQFMFWRCDVELTFVAVQTKFHSMRLQALMAYGAPGLVLGSRNVNYSSNMSFSPNDMSTNYVHTEVIPYNAQTEFLRTYEGEAVTDPIQNYSLGTFGVYVLNMLIAPDTVSDTVEVLVFLRFLNPKLAVPRPNSPFTWNGYLEYVPTVVYGFRGNIDHSEGRRAYFLDIDGVSGFPNVPMTSFQWSEGVVPVDGIYDIVAPRNFIFYFFQGESGDYVRVEYLISQVQILTGVLYFMFAIDPIGFTPAASLSYVVTNDFTFISAALMRPILPDIEFEAQGPTGTDTIEEVQPSSTGENTDEAERIVMTMEETPTRPNKPCKWEIGEKFEFTITDVHEIGRRYIRVIPITNDALDQFAVMTRTASATNVMNHLNVPVQPQNMWRGLFAAWAGSVKFRIFRNAQGFLPQVMFVPYYNRVVAQPGLPIIDAMQGFNFVAYSESYTSVSSITGPLAREVMYPISETNYIDVSAPFQSHYNFCYNSKTQDIAPISSGTLVMSYGRDDVPTAFTAFGDDLRLGVYRPPMTTTFNMTVFRNGIGGFSN